MKFGGVSVNGKGGTVRIHGKSKNPVVIGDNYGKVIVEDGGSATVQTNHSSGVVIMDIDTTRTSYPSGVRNILGRFLGSDDEEHSTQGNVLRGGDHKRVRDYVSMRTYATTKDLLEDTKLSSDGGVGPLTVNNLSGGPNGALKVLVTDHSGPVEITNQGSSQTHVVVSSSCGPINMSSSGKGSHLQVKLQDNCGPTCVKISEGSSADIFIKSCSGPLNISCKNSDERDEINQSTGVRQTLRLQFHGEKHDDDDDD